MPPVVADAARTDERLGRLVRVLTDNAMLVVSGTKLAQEIGASRSEVWRLVQQLRSLGVQIAGHPATGYQLEAVPDLLLPDILEPLVPGTIFSGRLHHYFRIGSTNAVAMQAAHAGEDEGAVFFAEEQTAGRGRGGHTWHSGRDGIYLSAILRPLMAPADAVLLSLTAGLAAAAAVEQVTGLQPDLRWPNDLLLPGSGRSSLVVGPSQTVGEATCTAATGQHRAANDQRPSTNDDRPTANDQRPTANDQQPTTIDQRPSTNDQRKFCGILTELNAEATRVRYAVVGIGMNVNQQRFPAELEPIATSLRIEAGRPCSRVELAAALLQSLDRLYRRLQAPDARELTFRDFEQRSSYVRGRRVHVDENGGYEGVTAGLDARGFLLVRAADGSTRTVLSGGVRAI